jgi:hypothetical protein
VELLLTLPATGPVTAAAIIAEIGTEHAPLPECCPSCVVGRRLSGQQTQCGQTTQWCLHQRQQAAQDHPVRDRGDDRSLIGNVSACALSAHRASTRQAARYDGGGP